jgi:DNA-binding NarL/FixJ family response regulator
MESETHKQILLVEDDVLIAIGEERMLKSNGYDVSIARSAEEAIAAVNASPPDIILMDINLGHGLMEGTEAAQIILREHDLPIVFLSGHSEKEMVEKVKGITRYGYVLKNSGEFVLIEAITMAFELFDKEQLIRERNGELQTLLAVSTIDLKKQDYGEALQKTTDSIVSLLDFDSSALYMLSRDSQDLLLQATTPPLPPNLPEFFGRARLDHHPHIKRCIETWQPVFMPDAREEQLTEEEAAIVEERDLRSNLYLPLSIDDQARGVLITSTSTVVPLSREKLDTCMSLANLASIMISNARRYQSLRSAVGDLA